MAVRIFALPDLGEGLEEAEIIEWHVAEGDRVVADQPLVSVETDKAVVEIPSPWSGTITSLRAAPGALLRVGASLAEIDDGSRSDKGAIVGSLEEDALEDIPRAEQDITPVPAASAIRAAPAARARARELGIDLSGVSGTGPDGAITRADVELAAEVRGAAGPSGARRSMARAMVRSGAEVVPATVTDVADITGWHEAGTDVTLRVVRAICAGVKAEPGLNRWYAPDASRPDQPEGIALGLAVDTPQGLYVPVVPMIDTMAADVMRAKMDEAIANVRARRPGGGATRYPTFTLSNFGAIGGRHAALVVTPPQVAILGVGRAYETVAWGQGKPVRAVELPLSLTFDHRAATGGEAARFLVAIVADLEKPDQGQEDP